MPFVASAPGKLVLLGEYIVLDGAPALVMACDRRCHARLGPSPDEHCRLTTRLPAPEVTRFGAGSASGAALVYTVLEQMRPALPWEAWEASIDSSAFFAGELKLGLGSSAAALVAFAGACRAASGASGPPELSQLIRWHQSFQGGAGSGIDIAAACLGGVLEFRRIPHAEVRTGSVRLPKSVGFAGIFAGGSASTSGLVGQYRRWAATGSASGAALRQRMLAVASGGCTAVQANDGAAFVGAIDEYGQCLDLLGRAIGADLVTAAHRRIGGLAGEFGLAYKVSGAGGGDIGIACGLDFDALRAFAARAAEAGFHVVPLAVDEQGLRVEEHAQ